MQTPLHQLQLRLHNATDQQWEVSGKNHPKARAMALAANPDLHRQLLAKLTPEQAARAKIPALTVTTQTEKETVMSETQLEANHIANQTEHRRLVAENARLKQQATYAPPMAQTPIPRGCEAVDGATERFQDLVEQFKSRGMNASRATCAAVKKNPALHHCMLAEVNADRPQALADRRITCGSGR